VSRSIVLPNKSIRDPAHTQHNLSKPASPQQRCIPLGIELVNGYACRQKPSNLIEAAVAGCIVKGFCHSSIAH